MRYLRSLLALSLLASTAHAQNSASSGSLGTLTVGPYVSSSTSTLSGPPTPSATLSVGCEYQNTTPAIQDSLSVTVQLLGGSTTGTVSRFFSRDAALAPYATSTLPVGTFPNPGIGAYLLQATTYLYSRQYRVWSTSAQRTFWLYIQQPLAVELVSFSYQQAVGGTWLKWRTASEKDNHHFVMERSTDGLTFERLATVAGHGTTSQAQAYTWLDASPATSLCYYRLRQVDTDGTAAYSPVLAVQPGAQQLHLWPNPAHEMVQVAGATEVAIYSLAGKQLLLQRVPESGLVPLRLPPGTYLVRAGLAHQRLTIY